MAEGDIIRSLPDGTQVIFPKGTSNEEINNYMGREETPGDVEKLFAPPASQDQAGGKIIPPIEGSQDPAIQYRGPLREPAIAATQFARGALSPVALPGDILTAANAAGAGIPFDLAPQLRGFPTSQSLDRLLSPITNSLTPEGFWENELAGGFRGIGEGASMLAGARAPGLAYTRYPWARAGSMPMNMLTGGVSGLASTGVQQGIQSWGINPDQNASLAPLAPIAAGAATGLGVGGGLRWLTSTPYERVVTGLGGNISKALPLEEDAGSGMRDSLINSMSSAPRTPGNMGLNGLYGTDLTKKDFNALTDSKASGEDIKALTLNPKIAPILRDEQPAAMDAVAASHLANATDASDWMNLHPRVRESLIPDRIDQRTVERTFAGGVIPGSMTYLQRLRATAAREGPHIIGLVGSEFAVDVARYFSEMTHADPSLQRSLALLGVAAPAAYAGARFLMSPVGRQTALGAAVGTGAGSYLAPATQPNPAAIQ